MFEDVIPTSRASKSNDGANIHFAFGLKPGRDDDCADGDNVQIFTTDNLSFSSSATCNGIQSVAAKSVELGASDQGLKGLAVQPGGNITLSSTNAFGLCTGDDALDDALIVTNQHYRVVLQPPTVGSVGPGRVSSRTGPDPTPEMPVLAAPFSACQCA